MKPHTKDYLFVCIGILGAIITLFGLILEPSHPYYIVGSFLLLSTAIYSGVVYFIALEMILIAGHASVYLGISSIELALPLLLCAQLFIFYFLSDQWNNIFLLIGIAGIAALSVGFIYENQWIFFFGSATIAVYSYSCIKTTKLSIIWFLLNSMFAIGALFYIIKDLI